MARTTVYNEDLSKEWQVVNQKKIKNYCESLCVIVL